MSQNANTSSVFNDDDELNQSGSASNNDNTSSTSRNLGSQEEEQQVSSSTDTDEDTEQVSEENESAAAAHAVDNPNVNLASGRRDPSSHPARANEATDRNDTGSGGIPAGGNRSGSSLQ